MEYKFRGKRIDNEEWVYGSYHYCTQDGTMRYVDYKDGNRVVDDKPVTFNCHWILEHKTPDTAGWDVRDSFVPHAVIPETLGMWTRLKDQYGNEIYGGDILTGIQSEQGKPNTAFETYDSVHNYKCGFSVFGKPMQTGYTKDNNVLYQFMWCNRGHHATPDYYYQLDNIEVVGNRIDNPDWQLNPLQRSSVTNTMNIDPNVKTEEVKEQATEDQAAINAAEDQANDAQGEPVESAEEGTTEG